MSPDLASLRELYKSGAARPFDVINAVYGRIRKVTSLPCGSRWFREDGSRARPRAAQRLACNGATALRRAFRRARHIDLVGLPTTAGCPAYAYSPGGNASVVRLLMEAGAIPIGKTNLDQFAMGLAGMSSPYGACSSIYDSRYISGGSSSGSAVAVASGQVSFALSSDTTGSGRVPAAFNNLAFPVNGAPALVLAARGSTAHLDPEVAVTRTLGFDFEAPGDPRLRFRATYFDIDYGGRIAVPDQTEGVLALATPDRFPGIVYATNSADLISDLLTSTRNIFNMSGIDLSNPAAAAQLAATPNFHIFDNRLRNLSDVRLAGVDVDVAYGADTRWGDISLGARATYMADYEEQVTPGAPLVTIVDTTLRPVDLRARAFIGLARDGMEATLAVSYVDSYRNPYSQGETQIDSWTTWDARLAFDLASAGLGVGSELSIGAKNIFDEPPPYVETSGLQGAALQARVGFDPANANPLGRSLWIELVKKW